MLYYSLGCERLNELKLQPYKRLLMCTMSKTAIKFFTVSYLPLPRQITSKLSYLTLIYYLSCFCGLAGLPQAILLLCEVSAGVPHSAGSSNVQDGSIHVSSFFTWVAGTAVSWLTLSLPVWPLFIQKSSLRSMAIGSQKDESRS